jgi:uncharacterized Zn-binding protein involved in type VI secretion
MGKPAARLTDMTAHGGLITGPGCPTVLIGKMPAARLTDLHVCPMVTPPAIPHVGGPILGPGSPTVLIGKLPAATLGDMATCVGPPSTILLGCMTVLIGPSGAGGGGGGGGSASDAQAAKTLAAATCDKIEGFKPLSNEIKEVLIDAAKSLSPEQMKLQIEIITGQLKGSSADKQDEEEEPKELTIKDLADILKAIESEEKYEAARFFAGRLDYGKITTMAMAFVKGLDTNTNNDPNVMPTRFMLIYGADDSKLQTIDDHPDKFENEEHKINVKNLRKGLKLLGYKVKDDGPYDNEVYHAHIRYIASAMSSAYPYDELEDDEGSGTTEEAKGKFSITLDINPENPDVQNDSFILYNTDSRKTYKQVKTVKDDADKKNNTLELVFTKIDEKLKYTLEIDHGSKDDIQFLFRNKKIGKE